MRTIYQDMGLRVTSNPGLSELVVHQTIRLLIVNDDDESRDKLRQFAGFGNITMLLSREDMVAVDEVLSSLAQVNFNSLDDHWLALSTWLKLNHPDLTEEQLTALRGIL